MITTRSLNFTFIMFLILSSLFTSTMSSISKSSTKSSTKTHSNTKNTSLSKKAGTRGVCRNGFGFFGQCFNGKDKLDASKIPSTISDLWSKIVQPLIRKIPQNPSLCLGDFSPERLGNYEGLKDASCDKIPLDPNSGEFGAVAVSADNVPCGKPISVNACVVFDRCGTVAFSINGGVITCVAAATTGVGAVLSLVSGAVKYIQFGFSYHKKFAMELSVVTPNYFLTGVEERKVTARGHIYSGLSFGFPDDWLKVGKLDLSKYMKIAGESAIMLNVGPIGSTITNIIGELKHMNKGTVLRVVKQVLHSKGEMAIRLEGTFTILLDSLTKGFLPDLEFNVNTAMIMTLGDSDTGLRLGFYITVKTDVISKLLGIIKKVYDRYTNILRKIGIPVPNFPTFGGIDITLGVFANKDAIGFMFKILGSNVYCMYKFANSNGSCGFNGSFFTAIAEAAKWVFKQVYRLFSTAGKFLMNIAQGAGKFVFNAAKAGFRVAKKIWGKAKKFAGKVWGKAKRAFRSGVNIFKRHFGRGVKKVYHHFKKAAKRLFGGIGRGLKSLFGGRRHSRRPTYRRKTYRRPTYRRPTYRRKTYRRPVYRRPVYRRHVYRRPVYRRHVFRRPSHGRRRRFFFVEKSSSMSSSELEKAFSFDLSNVDVENMSLRERKKLAKKVYKHLVKQKHRLIKKLVKKYKKKVKVLKKKLKKVVRKVKKFLKKKRHDVNWARKRFLRIIKRYANKGKIGTRTARKLLKKIKKKHHFRKVIPSGRRVWRNKKLFKKLSQKGNHKRGNHHKGRKGFNKGKRNH